MIQPYLFFSGRCEEAIDFYQQAIGLELQMKMRFSESPDATPPGMLQDGFEDKIMHATVKVGSSVWMMSDGCDDKSKFDGFRLSLTCDSPAAAARAFEMLSVGGTVIMPLTKTFWSPCFGMLTDKFGVGWMVTTPAEQS